MPRTALLGQGFRRASCFAIQEEANPAKRVGAKQDGGGRRTLNLEVIRRPDLQSAPFATRDTPRLTASANPPAETGGGQGMDDVQCREPMPRLAGWRVLWGKQPCKVNQGPAAEYRPRRGSNCHIPEPVTQAAHERSRSKAAFWARRRQGTRTRPRTRPAGAWRDRADRPRTGPVPVRLAHGGGGTQHIRLRHISQAVAFRRTPRGGWRMRTCAVR